MNVLLIATAFAFAWSMGAHYTGACMGMPHALGAIDARRALLVMAPLALLGAALASHGVERTVATRLTDHRLGVVSEVVVVAVAFAVTSAYNRLKVPTSTIQILVFALVGTALAGQAGVRWSKIGVLAVLWAVAPLAACVLGFALTRAFDRVVKRFRGLPSRTGADVYARRRVAAGRLGVSLVLVGAVASFAMGSNDVANAAGPVVGAKLLSPATAGTLGGVGLALGVLTYGRPLLSRVAFEIVHVDRTMATAAQAVQGGVVLATVAFGLFTSMNQALVGAMAGTGVARGKQTVDLATLAAILRGWLLGPAAGLAVAFLVAQLLLAVGAHVR